MTDFIILGSKITEDGNGSHEIKGYLLLKGSDKAGQHIKKQKHYFANKGRIVKAAVFQVVMYGCESWTLKKNSTEELMFLNTSQVPEKTLESPLNSKEMKPVHPKRN